MFVCVSVLNPSKHRNTTSSVEIIKISHFPPMGTYFGYMLKFYLETIVNHINVAFFFYSAYIDPTNGIHDKVPRFTLLWCYPSNCDFLMALTVQKFQMVSFFHKASSVVKCVTIKTIFSHKQMNRKGFGILG